MRRKQLKYLPDLPPLDFKHTDVALRCGPWTEGEKRRDNSASIKCEVRLNGLVPSSSGENGITEATVRSYWVVRITKSLVTRGGKQCPSKHYVATIALVMGREVIGGPEPLLRGQGTHWKDAIDEVGMFSLPEPVLAKLGRAYLGEPSKWAVVRPLRVTYPWKDPGEPNAKYSPIRRVGDHEFDLDTDGAVVSFYGGNTQIVARTLTSHLGGNAFLMGPDAQGRFNLYHHEYMNASIVIDIDDYRARLIAGTGDE